MVRFLRRHPWLLVAPIYWLCAYWLLAVVFPILFDGSGPTATFYWGSHRPAPTLTEYQHDQSIRLQFLYPYWVAAALIVTLGYGVTKPLAKLLMPRKGSSLLVSFGTCLGLLLFAAAISDAGVMLYWWNGPRMYGSLSSLGEILKVVIPASLCAAIFALARGYTGERDRRT